MRFFAEKRDFFKIDIVLSAPKEKKITEEDIKEEILGLDLSPKRIESLRVRKELEKLSDIPSMLDQYLGRNWRSFWKDIKEKEWHRIETKIFNAFLGGEEISTLATRFRLSRSEIERIIGEMVRRIADRTGARKMLEEFLRYYKLVG
jgi:Mor family transcriptional regulator